MADVQLAAWHSICRPKILAKWFIKFTAASEEASIWRSCVSVEGFRQALYGGRAPGTSSLILTFIAKHRDQLTTLARLNIKRGNITNFWHNTIIDGVPLAVSFLGAYCRARDTYCSVADVLELWSQGVVEMIFKEASTVDFSRAWHHLRRIITRLSQHQSDHPDSLEWKFWDSRHGSARQYYMWVMEGGKRFWWATEIWTARGPPKVAVFLWLLFNNKLPTTSLLSRRGIDIQNRCARCDLLGEDVGHLFMQCSVSTDFWNRIAERRNVTLTMSTLEHLWSRDLHHGDQRARKRLIAAGFWSLWLSRNRRVFTNRSKTIYKIVDNCLKLEYEWPPSSWRRGCHAWQNWLSHW